MSSRSASLQTRLVVTCVAIALAGMAATAFVSWRSLANSLTDRTDRSIQSIVTMPVSACLGGATTTQDANGCFGASTGRPAPPLPQGAWVELIRPDGTVLVRRQAGALAGDDAAGGPQLDASLIGALRAHANQAPRTEQIGPTKLRIAAHVTQAGALLVIGVPLTDVTSTLHSLLEIEITVGLIAGVLVLIAVLIAVRRGLRPLRRIAARAEAMVEIEHLGERLPGTGDAREIAQLSRALNGMLERIERGVDQQRRTERRLRQFVGDASHELRTPITAIRGQAQLLTSGASAAGETSDEDRIRSIDGHAARLADLVEQLLDLTRLDEDRPLDLERLDLATIVGEAVADAQTTDPQRTYRPLKHDRPADMRADRVQIQRVLANLLGNARAHTPAGSSVEVSCIAEGDSVVLRVDDDGPGLSAAERERAFDRFWRSARSRAGDEPGTGLGLALVEAVAAAHGGMTSLGESPAGGLRVEVRLPAHL